MENSSHASGLNALCLMKTQFLKTVISFASVDLRMVVSSLLTLNTCLAVVVTLNTMVLYILFDLVLRGQAMVAQICQERHQCHCKSIALLFPLIRCLESECNVGIYAGQKLKPSQKS